jgi:hypothetical protein
MVESRHRCIPLAQPLALLKTPFEAMTKSLNDIDAIVVIGE